MDDTIIGLVGTLTGTFIGGAIGYFASLQQWRIAAAEQARREFDTDMRLLTDATYDCIAYCREYWLNSHLMPVKELRAHMSGRSPLFRLCSLGIYAAPDLREHVEIARDAMLRIDTAPLPISDDLHEAVAEDIYRLVGVTSRYRNSRDATEFTPQLFRKFERRSPEPFEPRNNPKDGVPCDAESTPSAPSATQGAY